MVSLVDLLFVKEGSVCLLVPACFELVRVEAFRNPLINRMLCPFCHLHSFVLLRARPLS